MVAGRIQQYVYDNTIDLSPQEQELVRKKIHEEENDPRTQIADYLTRKPEITYFRSVYRQHSAFAIENIAHELTGCIGYGNLSLIHI